MKKTTLALGSFAFALALAGCSHKDEIMPTATPSPEATAPQTQGDAAPAQAAAQDSDAGAIKRYVVRKGDNLWAIAGRADVLGDPMRWPLLYRSNRDAITDPDLISVDQELSYSSASIPADVAQAMREAQETPPYVRHTQARKTLPLVY